MHNHHTLKNTYAKGLLNNASTNKAIKYYLVIIFIEPSVHINPLPAPVKIHRKSKIQKF